MKVLTASEMREVDRRTIEMGIPGIVLMENAAHRVVEAMAARFAPLTAQRIVVLCGKGNNGGDGLAIARQLHTRFHPPSLDVVLLANPDELKGDAAANLTMLRVAGCAVESALPVRACLATLVVDALLGTGISGAASGRMLEGIGWINTAFPLAKVVAVDIPSGMVSDSPESEGEIARADCTVTFTAPKPAHVLPPNCDRVGELVVAPIGSPEELYKEAWLSLIEPSMFRELLAPRPPSGHKGTFGHVLVIAGSRGKTGAAAMSGIAALRAGAGLVTVASAASAVPSIAAHAPELMTEPLAETHDGSILQAVDLDAAAEGKTVIAIGPGLGRHAGTDMLVSTLASQFARPMVIDADALGSPISASADRVRVLTPHPGEMSRLTGRPTADILRDRVNVARAFARERQVILVLKGQRSLIAFSDGRVWINPTGTPAMGKGGSGDILTGIIAGFLAQFPTRADEAVAAAVYLHGLSGEIGVRSLGDKCLLATDLLTHLPEAIAECRNA